MAGVLPKQEQDLLRGNPTLISNPSLILTANVFESVERRLYQGAHNSNNLIGFIIGKVHQRINKLQHLVQDGKIECRFILGSD